MSVAVALVGLVVMASGPPAPRIAEAEQLSAESRAGVVRDPEGALRLALQALEVSAEFVATDFVKPGARREVLEDEFVAARAEYRLHRSGLYRSAGLAFGTLGRQDEAVRYLRRALDLDPDGERSVLVTALASAGRRWEALEMGLEGLLARPPSAVEVVQLCAIADVLGVSSLQGEIDRVRIERNKVEPRLGFVDGPFELGPRSRLSTGELWGLTGEPRRTLIYVAEDSCRTCSADLGVLARLAPRDARVVVAPARDSENGILRQTLALYKYPWPVAMGVAAEAVLHVTAPCVVVVGRRGWSAGVARHPFDRALPALLALMAREDVEETPPRGAWNHAPARRVRSAERPMPQRGSLLPGEDLPLPDSFAQAQRFLDAGRPGEALGLVEELGRSSRGWLLPPELRLNRALLLSSMGRREEARALLRRVGDSRFQAEADALLERLGTRSTPP